MFVDTNIPLNNFRETIDSSLEYYNIGNTSGNITLKMNRVTTAHFTGNHTITLPTITDTTKQNICVLDFTTTNTAYPSITNTNIKWKDGSTASYSLTQDIPKNITGASTTTPIEITIASHGYQNGDIVTIASVGGNTAANGTWTITKTGVNTFTLNTSVGNDTYTTGGTAALYITRNKLIFTSNNSSDNWEVEYKKFGYLERAFSQPLLSANGTLGGASFAVSGTYYAGYYIWQAFDNNVATWWLDSLPTSLIMYNPNPVKATSISFQNISAGTDIIYAHTISGSNDNISYTTLATATNSNTTASATWNTDISSGNQAYYKYYKVTVTTGSATYNGVAKITINGTELLL